MCFLLLGRSHASKGSAHVVRNQKRLEKHLAASGRAYINKDQVRTAAAEAATGLRGTAATAVHGHIVQNMPSVPPNWTKEQMFRYEAGEAKISESIKTIVRAKNLMEHTEGWCTTPQCAP